MHYIQIGLEDWQRAALAAMARARGTDLETLAQRLLSERLHERADAWMAGLIGPPSPGIEHRLRQLFDE